MVAAFAAAVVVSAVHPGQQATIDVPVATLWQSPSSPRSIDAPALGNPVDLDAWNRNLSSTPARAGLGGRVVTQALYDEKVTVLAVRSSWAKVAVPDQPSPLDRRGYPGWLPLRQIVSGYSGSGKRLTVVVPKATLHLGARKLVLSYGTRLQVTGPRAGGAWSVRTPDGAGWITRSQLAAPASLTGAHVVDGAKRFIGLRYLWGGVSGWGFDCSGLVWDVFHTLGKTVPRDSAPQSHGGRAVVASLRPGDLVFYGSPATHVAIVAGNGKMIESPDSAHAVRLVPLRHGYTFVRRYTTR